MRVSFQLLAYYNKRFAHTSLSSWNLQFYVHFRAGSSNSGRYLVSQQQQLVGFHSTARREEEAKEDKPADDGFMGTGLSHLYAIPVGVAFAVPAIEFEWFLVNEETLVRWSFGSDCKSKLWEVSNTFV